MGATRQGLRGILSEQDVIQARGLGMGAFVDPGNSSFQSAARPDTYIDKTKLIQFTNSVLAKQADARNWHGWLIIM